MGSGRAFSPTAISQGPNVMDPEQANPRVLLGILLMWRPLSDARGDGPRRVNQYLICDRRGALEVAVVTCCNELQINGS